MMQKLKRKYPLYNFQKFPFRRLPENEWKEKLLIIHDANQKNLLCDESLQGFPFTSSEVFHFRINRKARME